MQHRAIRYRSGMDVLRITWRREGVGGLYKGIVPNVLRVMPQSAVTFLVYETAMKYLNSLDAPSALGQKSAR
jgi:solute carrier family 25 (mitochondrial folate transporter), member 32